MESGIPEPVPAEEPKQISAFRKAGWSEASTKFKTEAPIFAEFEIPAGEGDPTLVEFQVLRLLDGKFVPYASMQGLPDKAGKAIARVAIYKDRLETENFPYPGPPWR